MTDRMKEFLLKMADLMKEYRVEFEVAEKCHTWDSSVDGIDIVMSDPYDTVSASRYLDADELRTLAGEKND